MSRPQQRRRGLWGLVAQCVAVGSVVWLVETAVCLAVTGHAGGLLVDLLTVDGAIALYGARRVLACGPDSNRVYTLSRKDGHR